MDAEGAHCQTCPTREACEWSLLGDADIARLDQAKITKHYRRGQTVYAEGDEAAGIFCLKSGSVAILKTDEDGNTALIRMGSAGETLGYRSFLAGDSHSTSGEAIVDCEICTIPGSLLHDFLARNSDLGLGFLSHSARDMREVGEMYLRLATGTVRSRLAYFLATLRDAHGHVDDGELTIELPLSRQDIAAMIGTRPETLSRTIRGMAADGVAKFDDRSVHVPDPAALFGAI